MTYKTIYAIKEINNRSSSEQTARWLTLQRDNLSEWRVQTEMSDSPLAFLMPMTKPELLKTHKDYKLAMKRWDFFIRSYDGGDDYRDGNYLIQHPFESDPNYKRRKEIAYFYNYCAPIIDIYVSYLMRNSPKRTYGNLSTEVVPPREPKTLFDAFWWDCDLEGTNFEQFMRDAQRYASIYGRVSIIVDKPAMIVDTQAQAREQGIRPYLNLITPENMLDWEYVRLRSGRPVLSMVKIRESDTEYRIWTMFGWTLWRIGPEDTGGELIDFGMTNIGEIPIVTLYNKKSRKRQIGVSDINDIADINKNIYYFCSDAQEIIENTAFPMLALAKENTPPPAEGTTAAPVGPKNIQEFDPDASNGKPFWLEPPHSSLQEIREWIQQNAQEMARMAQMGGMRNMETSTQPWSGISIQEQETRLFATLNTKATNSEQAELDIFRLYSLWEDETFSGNVEYSRDFAIKDMTTALNNAIQAGTQRIESLTFEKARQKKIVDATLPDIEESDRDTIYNEIEKLDKLPTPVAVNPGTTGGNIETGGATGE